INHYDFDHGDGRTTTFADLLYQIHEATPTLPRLRFVTSFPRDFTDQALMAMRDCERICRYLHVPAQHGNDRILKLMNRGYTANEYIEFVDRARAFMPDISLASDFIVGFPTETDEEFDQTMALLRRCRFKNSFIFKYSPRPGTTAIKRFEDDVPEPVKKKRNNALLAVQGEVAIEVNAELVGQKLEVMVEGESKLVSKQSSYPASQVQLGAGFNRRSARTDELADEPADEPVESITQLVGRSRGDQIVVFDGPISLKGELLTIEITSAKQLTLFGRRPNQFAPV
ncbi:MAG TPA: radical SAM protein, partial [Tepidisphaeraceae bacterium]|nr:radical SAM protein [Tepidisphaeraceae bacterium]